ncbi:twin-arginine translocase subunit TatC [Capillimicrobium parvum]|uniref:Sec-independent protein translocase protein TatC n=1 Tax=Capillimicrobium parvum TaxID=2884022 RepID=A0A9E6Y8F8_9ACTN|nr:twin-arginine translocase subunit TatC [Capillimicrobium parvum]UGS39293.1 Sec-independent protein translocase protein TatC [Capillimicrobium parvum]
MASTALRRPIGHEERLSLVDHLDELRSRVIICLIAVIVMFGLCFWQNDRLLTIVNHPLESQTQKQIKKGQGPLGEISTAQKAVRALALSDRSLAAELAKPGSGLSESTRAQMAARVAEIDRTLKALPTSVAGNKPVTLGIGEPFMMTLLVAGMFSLILAMPIILYQAYAFVVPAFTPQERRVAVPLLLMVPALFVAGVAFGYFLVLPAAVRFLQNFNTDEFNVLVQARDYYKFVAMTLLAMGLVFQVPVGILALTRLRVITVKQLRKNRRYALVAIAVVAMLLPGTDPVSMLIDMVPLIILYELSILLASIFAPKDAVEIVDPEDTHAV